MTAVITNTEPCWTLVRPDGTNVSEFEPHFDTEAQAAEAALRYRTGIVLDEVPQRLNGPCSIATAACGYVYDQDGEGQEHWASAEELHAHLLTAGWRDLPGEEMHCHSDPGVCEECDALIPAPVPAQLPGQLDLISGAAVAR